LCLKFCKVQFSWLNLPYETRDSGFYSWLDSAKNVWYNFQKNCEFCKVQFCDSSFVRYNSQDSDFYSWLDSAKNVVVGKISQQSAPHYSSKNSNICSIYIILHSTFSRELTSEKFSLTTHSELSVSSIVPYKTCFGSNKLTDLLEMSGTSFGCIVNWAVLVQIVQISQNMLRVP